MCALKWDSEASEQNRVMLYVACVSADAGSGACSGLIRQS